MWNVTLRVSERLVAAMEVRKEQRELRQASGSCGWSVVWNAVAGL